MDYTGIIFFISLGLASGFLSGYLGIGGGVIIIPALMYFLNGKIPSDNLFLIVSGLSVCAVLISAVNSAYRHMKADNYYRKSVVPLALGALIGPFPGNFLCSIIDDRSRVIFFSVVMIALSVRVIFQKVNKNEDRANLNGYALFICGMLMGIITALTGLGGGAILVPMLAVIMKFDIKKAVGVSSIIMIFNSISFLTGRVLIDGFDGIPFSLSAAIIVVIGLGIMLTSGLGVKYHLKSSESMFRYVSGAVYLSVSALMIIKAV